VEKTNDLDPEILETRTDLYLELQLQQLIELISTNQVEKALVLAQQQLAPLCAEQQSAVESLENVMALLAFDNIENSPLAHLVHEDQRRTVASRLNKAILGSLCKEQEPRLPSVLQMICWAQHTLEKCGQGVCPKLDPVKMSLIYDDEQECQPSNIE